MRILRALLVGATASAVTLIVPPLAADAAPTAPYTVFTNSAAGVSSPLRGTDVYEPGSATFTWQPGANDALGMTVVRSGYTVDLDIAPPTGQSWTAGTNYVTNYSGNSTTASLQLTAGGSACSTATTSGSLSVKEVERAEGLITAFAATYSSNCPNFAPINGEIRWNSSVGFVATKADTEKLDFGSDYVGGTGLRKTVTLTAKGSEPSVVLATAIEGANPNAFAIVADTCDGQTLAAGATCLVTVEARATAAAAQQAILNVGINGVVDQAAFPLTVTGKIGAKGTYYKMSPARIMDTRSGLGTTKAAIGAGGVRHLQVTGRGGVPGTGVGAVVLNVTVVSPSAAGYLTVFPTGVARPTASSVNFAKGWTGANSVTVAVGTGGQVDIYNAVGSAGVIVDVAGYYAGTESHINSYGLGGQYQPIKPRRILDTRKWGEKLPTEYFTSVAMNFGDSDNYHIKAFVVNITAFSPDGNGFLTAWDGNEEIPATSTLNFTKGKTVPNMAIVPVGPCWLCEGEWMNRPSISVYTSKTTHILIDVVGVMDDSSFTDGLRFTPSTPTRIADSRTGLGLPNGLSAGETDVVTAPNSVITKPNTEALALNVTAVNPTASTWLTVWPNGIAGISQPTVSSLNPAKGQTVPNAVITQVGPTSAFNVFNQAGTTQVLIDVVGSYWLYPGTASGTLAAGQGVGKEPVYRLNPTSASGSIHRG
ncbi:hypothetical protein F4553_004751 [Allocatelliglobosispora scoriae]|uniref:Choice-of-anchor D domain-containing protein n=1 Tax=Allocatelliglobosispora scoriae TaxID=643052 RepID=A0A841BX81_9ACTN|nr:hypothetical protein [Allocatelliglobosispora scoriae]MBB5871372.1 hypothetical protein [Allocatelliglobosispora scoriae]